MGDDSMSKETLIKLEKLVIFFIILFLPITSLPQRFAIPAMGTTLSSYFLVLGLFLLLYEHIKFRINLNKNFLVYFLVFVGWQILCLALGLYFYEYNEYLTLDQSPKLAMILSKLGSHGIVLNELVAFKIWLFFRFLKDILFLNNQILVLAFLIWHLYKDDWRQGFYDIRKAVLCLVLLMGAYSFIELIWLKLRLPFSESFLKSVNVYLYDPVKYHGWWPPLLWWGQLRSLCHEPSFFGIISIFCLPFIWSFAFENSNRLIAFFLIPYYGLMIAATNARTAIIVTLGELFLLLLLTLMLKKKEWVKPVCIIFICMFMGFGVNLINFKALLGYSNASLTQDLSKYAERNIVSVTKRDSRSNSARLANMIANYETIKDFPVFGVGTSLKDAYVDARLPEFSYTNNEVRNWSRYMHNEGVLKSGYPALNMYLDVAVKNGIVGLILYMFPIIGLLFAFNRSRKLGLLDYEDFVAFISFVGLLFAQFSNTNLIVCNGITWGLMWCMVARNRDY